jgi:serine/threonine-protein kinase HipA
MRLRALDIYLEGAKVGQLFQYGEGPGAITRLMPDESFWRNPRAPLLSWATWTEPEEREAFWRSYAFVPFFNGEGMRLPRFFQNMLPEGALRRHLAQERGCALDDHFELFAACGTDLPGAVYAYPSDVSSRQAVEGIVTQHNDALEMSVVAEPIKDATSLSGLQAKLSLVANGGRYVARTRDSDGVHIIAKLPTLEFPGMPVVEHLSLQLAAQAGVTTCSARLASIDDIDAEIPFVLGEARSFLAVERFDRQDGKAHIHCEDFAQILGIPPEQKYSHPLANYAMMAAVLRQMKLGESAALELLRRITVNELLGNFDGHVKNFGVLYADGHTPQLSPAYDIVAYAAQVPGRGHALRFTRGGQDKATLTPRVVRDFCAAADIPETVAQGLIRATVKAAVGAWPDMIAESRMLAQQKLKLLQHFEAVEAVQTFRRRSSLGRRRKQANPS